MRPDFVMVFSGSANLGPGDTDSAIAPKNPLRSGTIVDFRASIIDPAYGNAAAIPASFYSRVAARITVGGQAIQGSASDDWIPLDCLLDTPAGGWNIPVNRDNQVTLELKSLDAANGATPDLAVRLVARVASRVARQES